jgi:hypothetical protein
LPYLCVVLLSFVFLSEVFLKDNHIIKSYIILDALSVLTFLIVHNFCKKYDQCYMYYGNTVEGALIMFSVKIMLQSKFYEGAFLSWFSAMNFMIECIGTNIHIVLPHCIQLYSHFPLILCTSWSIINENLTFNSVNQGILWWSP